ncbi:MAG: tetratricopeptide repeat protein, partial [Candidatus Omnitrophica bacterium]|nr:tetratricopeptide repeat protein [Candidatus Omnitrophota bacterium]
MRILTYVFQRLMSVVILFFVLEILCFGLGVAPLASDFAEGIIDKNRLSVHKPKGEIRVFAYGESTMYGAHYAPVSSPARWLEVYLTDFLPDKKIRVINFARMGKSSPFIYRTFRETLFYKPDVAVFYMGHNEFLPAENMKEVLAKARKTNAILREWLSKSRLISFLYRQILRLRAARLHKQDIMGHEVIETYPGGVDITIRTPRNEPDYWAGIEFFRKNVSGIVDLAAQKKVHVLFLRPVSNLKDFPPLDSAHMKDLTPQQIAEWDKFFAEGSRYEESGNLDQALVSYQKAYAIDDTYAILSYRMAEIYFTQGNFAEAGKFYKEAKDNDVMVVRATKEIDNVFLDLAKTKNLQYIDTEKIVASEALGGILGLSIVEDNAHFTIKGHQLIGRKLTEEIARRRWISPVAKWEFDRERPYEVIATQLGIDTHLLVSAYIKIADYFANHYQERSFFAKKAVELAPRDPNALRSLAWAWWISGDEAKAIDTYKKLK